MQKKINRGIVYVAGLLLLAMGIILNTKTGLGVSPIISVAYSVSVISGMNLGNMTLILYSIFVLIEMILHTIRRKKGEYVKRLFLDILQIPLSIVFTRFMNLFASFVPEYAKDCAGTFWGGVPARLMLLILAIILTGVGAAMSLNMRIIPNPGDGIVQAIADFTGKSVGFTKNCFDVCNVTITCIVGLIIKGEIIGIGAGTLLSVLGVGRVIAVYNHFWGKYRYES